MNSTHPFDLVIGLDRSDRKADLHFIDTRTGQAQKQVLDTSPESLHCTIGWPTGSGSDHDIFFEANTVVQFGPCFSRLRDNF